MDYTDRKLQKNNLIRLILCAAFALAALVLSRVSFIIGNSQANLDMVPAILSVVYIAIVFLGGMMERNKMLRIVSCGLACLMSACWLLPLGGLKINALAAAFNRGNGYGIAQLIEYLRHIFMIVIHALVVIDVIRGKRQKMQKLASFLLHAALVFFVSAIVLSLFVSPAYPEPAKFAGMRFWKHFFRSIFQFAPAAFNAFDISSASLFPVCDGAVLLLLGCVVRIYGQSSAMAGQALRTPVMEPVQAAPVRNIPANPQRPAAPAFVSRTAVPARPAQTAPVRTAPVNPVQAAPARPARLSPAM